MTLQSIFEKNIEALEANNPELVKTLRTTEASGVELEQTKNGEYTFNYKGLYFHSRYDPTKEAKVQLEEIVASKADWVVLFGLGCGYLFKELAIAREQRDAGAQVVVFEPSIEILVGVLKQIDLSKYFSEPSIYIYHDLLALELKMSRDIEGMDDILGYQSRPYKQAFAPELMDFMEKVSNARMVSKVYIKTDITSRLVWLENYFANVDNFFKYPGVGVLIDKFKGIPMVIVGAGPSLEKNVHILKEMKGKVVSLAAISAYMPLLHNGIIPDLIVCGEKTDLPGHFTGSPEDKKVRLLLSDVVHPNMLRREAKGKFIFVSTFMRLSLRHAGLWGQNYCPDVGGSVTTTALSIGVDFGCDPVVMIGQDLAFGEHSTHAEGATYSDQSLHFEDNGLVKVQERYANSGERVQSEYKVLWLEGVNGERVRTKFDWVTFHSWFTEYMRRHHEAESTTHVINATEGGAYIEGMEHMTLKEVQEKYVSKDYPIEDILSMAESSVQKIDYDGLLSSYTAILTSLKKIKAMALSIIGDVNKVKKIFDIKGLSPEMTGHVGRIQDKEKKLFKESHNVIFMWETVVEYTYELKEYLREDIEKGSVDQIARDLKSIKTTYVNVRDAAGRFIPIMEHSIERVEVHKGKAGFSGADSAKTPAKEL